MKLWHDDVRPAPKGWVWAKTNEEAQKILKEGNVTEGSFDHDLGADESEGVLARGSSQFGSGLDLIIWMIENDLVPSKINIHSWNEPGSNAMMNRLIDAGYHPSRVPFNMSWLT